MATAYGRITGNRGSATRCGSAASGMTATVQTWEGALTLYLDSSGEWTLHRHRAEPNGRHSRYGAPIASGSVVENAATPVRIHTEENAA